MLEKIRVDLLGLGTRKALFSATLITYIFFIQDPLVVFLINSKKKKRSSFYLPVNTSIKCENTKCALEVLGATTSVISGKFTPQEHRQWITTSHAKLTEKLQITHTV